MKIYFFILALTAVSFVNIYSQTSARRRSGNYVPHQSGSDVEIGIPQYPTSTYLAGATQRLLEMKAPTWLMAQVYRSDDAIKHVVKYFKAEAEKAKNPKEPNGILKSLMRDNWKIRESRMASVSSIFGIGSELRQSAADEDVETSFGVIVLDDSMVRVHLLSPHASLTNSNKLVSGTMVVLIKERLPQPSESLADDNNAEGEKVYTGREVTVRARVKSKPEPESPSPGTYGTVVLKVVFSASGTVTNISVVVGLPNGLTEAAIKAARKISFEPAIKDGRYVSTYVELQYSFSP